jgi:hypothetical protein
VKPVYVTAIPDQELFAAADAAYEDLKRDLVSNGCTALDHAQIERLVTSRGSAVLLQLLQGHFTLRGQLEPKVAVVGADGKVRRHAKRGECRQLKTALGTVVVERTAFGGRLVSSLHPVDSNLNLPAHKYSHELERLAVLAAVDGSFEKSAALVCRTTATSLAKRPIEDIVRRSAKDFLAFYEARQWTPASQCDTGPLMVLSFDQKGIVVRPNELRPATRRIAARQRPRLRAIQNRDGKKHWHGKKRMASVAAVHTIEPDVRSPRDIVRGLRRLKPVPANRQRTVRPQMKRLWATIQRDPRELIEDAFTEAQKRDPDQRKTWVVLIDGDPDLERWVRATARRRQLKVTLGLDIIHVLQYLWRAGEALCRATGENVEQWLLPRLEKVLAGEISDVIAGLRRSATRRKLGKTDRGPVDLCARYCLKRKKMMRYGELLRIGAPVSTGVIEGGCKHLIGDRMDLCGARWSLEGAEAILQLRATAISGDFEEYWAYHERADYQRNHALNYAHGAPPPVTERRSIRATPRAA